MDLQRLVIPAPGRPDFTNNVYLVGGERSCVVIDPAHDGDAIASDLGSREVRAIVISHGHWDHVGGAVRLRALTGAPVLLHRADWALWSESVPDAMPDGELTDGEILPLGWGSPSDAGTIEVRHTPGHTPGSCAFVVWPQGAGAGAPSATFTGDTLFPGGPGATRWSYSSFPGIIDSIQRRLFTLPDSTPVYPGHGEATTVGAEAPSLPEWVARGW